MLFADVIVDISHESIDKIFQYKVPERLCDDITIGMKVLIPFGKGNKRINGYVVGLGSETDYEVDKIKEIINIDNNSITIENNLIKLAYYIKDTFGGTINEALKVVLPVKDTVKEKNKRKIVTKADKEVIRYELEANKKKNNTARVRVLEAVLKYGSIDYDYATYQLKITKSVIDYFVSMGLIEVETIVTYRSPFGNINAEDKRFDLNDSQRYIVEDFIKEYDSGIRNTYLIHGVTGSGKTLVFMEMIEHVIAKGKQVIMLIPEIALTYQTVNRFYGRFKDKVSILNSRMSKGERYDQYLRAKNHDISIMIGPRSALFTPFDNIGLIIMDEEHENSYKSENVPKYHAREVAIERARMSGASVVLGSATPSLEAYYRAKKGIYKLYEMTKRANDAVMPKVWIEDMRAELKAKNKSIFSRRLYMLINERLARKEQIMLFINRRGYSGFVSCRSCGYVFKCPHCDISLTYHSTVNDKKYDNNGKLVCHYCGYEQSTADVCPECGSDYIALFGTGTQKIEDYVKRMFPMARVLRMDADTTGKKHGHENILSDFAKGNADILVGTQMIVKGHDFPNVTLVGILAADLSLNTNDYKASERTFQLISQAAGRSGRGEKKGEVVIQTYRPEHYSITSSACNDYVSFYEKEIAYRSFMQYPPVANIMVMLIISKQEEYAEALSEMIASKTETICGEQFEYRLIGPVNATLSKANDYYRKLIYIKSNDYDTLKYIKNNLEKWLLSSKQYSKCNVFFDFNPVNGY
ncbi:MAG: primosomal protein N' [Lachnospiraceae bacterium]|nr:primosomal protein N' [Lachnospiraceae bacterium]